jgi:uncharacterized protein (TIGR02453 family)
MDFQPLFEFLQNLSENNNREWFNANKTQYLIHQRSFEGFIQKTIPLIAEIDPGIGQIQAKDCIFRIYRDVRFSLNKEPYKTHFGAYISKNGRKSQMSGYYLHFQPGQSFFAAGAYQPQPNVLKEIRYEILENFDVFYSITQKPDFVRFFSGIEGEKLKTAPKDFPKAFPHIELLKYKSFEIIHKMADEVIYSNTIEQHLLKLVKAAKPYNMFFNSVISHVLDEDNPVPMS